MSIQHPLSRSSASSLTFCTVLFTIYCSSTPAQIIPDTNLPTTSVVLSEGAIQRITGGSIAGNNLFHSFSQFNILTGETAFFDQGSTIENIITRVTGGTASNIDGVLRANGTANLFLINPNGISFGNNAQLNIGGAFVGSTAQSISFEDETLFSAINPTVSPLLTVSVPIGLQYGTQTNALQIQGSTLQGNSGQTITLVGGDISLNGATVSVPEGKITLGTASGMGEVSLDNGFGITEISGNRGNLTLSNASLIEVTEDSQGIEVITGNLTLETGGRLQSTIATTGTGGDLHLNVTDIISISGISNENSSGLFSTAEGTGNGGNIILNTEQLFLNSVGTINATTQGSGQGGNLTITGAIGVSISDTGTILSTLTQGSGNAGNIEINGEQILIADNSNVNSITQSTGNAGNIDINTGIFEINNRSFLRSNTEAQGNAGNVTLNATESIKVDGNGSIALIQSQTNASATGQAGTIAFQTNTLELVGDSLVLATSFGTGDAGNITVSVTDLLITEGSQIGAIALGDGDAGSVIVEADTILIDGLSPGGRSGLFANAINDGIGVGGDVIVTATELILQNGATISASNFQSTNTRPPGRGGAGNVQITVNSLLLDNDASLTTAATTGDQGSLFLNANQTVLRRESTISSNAVGDATGGNITLNTDVLVGLENSDITANAEAGQGGGITITADNIFGLEILTREELLQLSASLDPQEVPSSDITAISTAGSQLSGTITITSPEVDTSAGVIELSDNIVDSSQQIVVGCGSVEGSSFEITGRGGFHENPLMTLRGQTLWQDWQDFSLTTLQQVSGNLPHQVVARDNIEKIIEATGWRMNEEGILELVAETRDSRFWVTRTNSLCRNQDIFKN